MEDYYMFGEGKSDPEADELWVLYDYLAEFFGKRSDYELEDKEVQDLYEDFTNGVAPSHQYFEGNQVEDYDDLLYLQEAEKQGYLNTLLDEMARQESIVRESEEYISGQYSTLDFQIEELLDRMDDEDDRLAGMEDLIRREQTRQSHRDNVSAKALKLENKEATLTDIRQGGFAGAVNPATIDPRYVETAEQPETLSSTGEQAITTEDLNREVEKTEQEMLYAFAVFSLTMLVTGLAIGSCCIYFIIKKLRADRSTEAATFKNGGGPGHSRVDSTMPIQCKEDSVDNSGIRRVPNLESQY